ncbi:MAG: hypothetical protein PHS17_18090 [Desulfobacterales bacterium]|nr:hypothetical protein [Desulfobacterales bacterium]
MADESLKKAAEVNPEGKFELVFKNVLETFFVERMDQNEEIFVRFMNPSEAGQGLARFGGIPETAGTAGMCGRSTGECEGGRERISCSLQLVINSSYPKFGCSCDL